MAFSIIRHSFFLLSLLLLLFNASPEERGLVEFRDEENAIVYHFPDDYDANIQALVTIQNEKLQRKNLLHTEERE